MGNLLIHMLQEVRVRFVGYGAEDDEWVNVKAAIRQRSVPYESSECISVFPGEIVLCFQVSLSKCKKKIINHL